MSCMLEKQQIKRFYVVFFFNFTGKCMKKLQKTSFVPNKPRCGRLNVCDKSVVSVELGNWCLRKFISFEIYRMFHIYWYHFKIA